MFLLPLPFWLSSRQGSASSVAVAYAICTGPPIEWPNKHPFCELAQNTTFQALGRAVVRVQSQQAESKAQISVLLYVVDGIERESFGFLEDSEDGAILGVVDGLSGAGASG